MNFLWKELFFLSVALWAYPVNGAEKKVGVKKKPQKTWYTYWTNYHYKPLDPLAIYPGVDIPEHPEKFVWQVILGGGPPSKEVTKMPTEIPLYLEDPLDGILVLSGKSVQVGSEVILDKVRAFNTNLYYSINQTESQKAVFKTLQKTGRGLKFYDRQKVFLWISGHNLKAAKVLESPPG